MSASPNAEHIAVWNDILVPKFTRYRHVIIEGLGAHGAVALDRHGPAAGERVIDVGCGFGDSTLALARAVGASGHTLGIDCCAAFMADAQAEARRDGLAHVHFDVADAQTHTFAPTTGSNGAATGAGFDLVYSRFGTMFFANPVAAMKNIGRALRPRGRLVMVVWRHIDDNDWLGIAKRIARSHLPPPADNAPSCGPGPLSMADANTVSDILLAAGFIDIRFERVDRKVFVGRDIDDAVGFQLALGPAGEIVREAGAMADAKRPLIEADLAKALESFRTPTGIALGSSSWIVTAARAA